MKAKVKRTAKAPLRNDPPKRQWLSAIIYVLPLALAVGGAIWWASGIDKEVRRISEIEKKIDTLTEKVGTALAGNNGTIELGKSVSLNYTIGLINEKLAKDKKSSFGLSYELGYNICETNASSERWHELGGLPYEGQFLRVSNSYNKYESWCMNIGQFSDINNPNRMIIVSNKVARDLNMNADMGTLVGRIELIPDEEWKRDSGKVILHDQVYGLK